MYWTMDAGKCGIHLNRTVVSEIWGMSTEEYDSGTLRKGKKRRKNEKMENLTANRKKRNFGTLAVSYSYITFEISGLSAGKLDDSGKKMLNRRESIYRTQWGQYKYRTKLKKKT